MVVWLLVLIVVILLFGPGFVFAAIAFMLALAVGLALLAAVIALWVAYPEVMSLVAIIAFIAWAVSRNSQDKKVS